MSARTPTEESLRWVLHAMGVLLLCCAIAALGVSSPALSDRLFVLLAVGSLVWGMGWFVVSGRASARESTQAQVLLSELGLRSDGPANVARHLPGKRPSGFVDDVYLEVEEFAAEAHPPDYSLEWRTRFRAEVRNGRDLDHFTCGPDAVGGCARAATVC